MSKTRKRSRKQNHDDASNKDTIKTYENRCVAPWSDLNNDVLLSVMMQIGAVDFLSFSLVCKSWRSLALINRNIFLVSKPPMSVHVFEDANECYLEDFEGRKFKIILPHSVGRTCIGVTCGYLILLGEETNGIWLVNLVTRHELHFPNVPYEIFCFPISKAILVFSPSSGWVFVVLKFCTHAIWFSIEGKREWIKVCCIPSNIHDIHAFKGKIYVIQSLYGSNQVMLWELRLYPEPIFVFLVTKSSPEPDFIFPRFVSYGENLYVIDRGSKHPYKIHQLDFGKMNWVSCRKAVQEYAFFHSKLRHGHTVILPESCVVAREGGKGKLFHAKIWYFFHDCLNANLIHE